MLDDVAVITWPFVMAETHHLDVIVRIEMEYKLSFPIRMLLWIIYSTFVGIFYLIFIREEKYLSYAQTIALEPDYNATYFVLEPNCWFQSKYRVALVRSLKQGENDKVSVEGESCGDSVIIAELKKLELTCKSVSRKRLFDDSVSFDDPENEITPPSSRVIIPIVKFILLKYFIILSVLSSLIWIVFRRVSERVQR